MREFPGPPYPSLLNLKCEFWRLPLIDRPHLSNYVVHGVIMDMCDLLFSWLLYLIVCY